MLAVVAAVAIAGLLSMHGLEGVVVDLSGSPHAGHSMPAEGTSAIGLCVFVALLTGLAVSAVEKATTTTLGSDGGEGGATPSSPAPLFPGLHRSFLHRLCVLRL